MRRLSGVLITLLLCSSVVYADSSPKELYRTQEIVLGRFDVRDGKAVIPEGEPNWPSFRREFITVDDSDNVYVLDSEHGVILLYDPLGNYKGKLKIPNLLLHKINGTRYAPSFIEVSGDGSIMYLSCFGFFHLVTQEGRLIKKIDIIGSEVNRECRDRYLDRSRKRLFDKNLNLVASTPLVFSYEDSKGYYYLLKDDGARLGKFHQGVLKPDEEKEIWKTKIAGYEKIIDIPGIDGKDNVYLFAKPESGGTAHAVKLDGNARVIAWDEFPSEAPFLSEEELKEWIATDSEELFENLRTTCNGSVFEIYNYYMLPKKTYQRWLNKGKYYIRKFARVSLKGNANFQLIRKGFNEKKYDGNTREYDKRDLELVAVTLKTLKLQIQILRNEIFARHGRIFESEDLKRIFEACDWYKPNPNYSDDMLNDIEKKNIQFILDYEKKMGWR